MKLLAGTFEPATMREFKFTCPVCSQHIKSTDNKSGTTMECPTCFQRIVVPNAPASSDSRIIVTAKRSTAVKLPVAEVRNPGAGSGPKIKPAASEFPVKKVVVGGSIAVIVIAVLAIVAFVYVLPSKNPYGQPGPLPTFNHSGGAAPVEATPSQPANGGSGTVATRDTLPPQISTGRVGFQSWDTQFAVSNMVVTSEGKVLYTGEFYSSKPKGWSFGTGTWVGANGLLEQLGAGTDPTAVVGEDSWANYIYKTQILKLSGSQGFMLIFNFKNINNYAILNIGCCGNASTVVEAVVDGVKSSGSSIPTHIDMNRWYNVEIDVHGGNARCYLDSKLIATVGNY
jgi:DNA-directed RNA polymerase subunit RPC12/RpoP